jgi:hypothetical protein
MFYNFSKKFDIFLIKNRSIFLIKYGSKIVSLFLPSLFFIQTDKNQISFLFILSFILNLFLVILDLYILH